MKRKMRNILLPIFIVCILIGVIWIVMQIGKKDQNDIVILYTNDVHCGIEENIGYAGLA